MSAEDIHGSLNDFSSEPFSVKKRRDEFGGDSFYCSHCEQFLPKSTYYSHKEHRSKVQQEVCIVTEIFGEDTGEFLSDNENDIFIDASEDAGHSFHEVASYVRNLISSIAKVVVTVILPL